MGSVGLLPGVAIAVGAVCATVASGLANVLLWLLPGLLVASLVCWSRGLSTPTCGLLALGFWASGVLLATSTADNALHSRLRDELDREVGGFAIEGLGPAGDHDPILTRAVLIEDASPRDGFVSLRARVTALRWRHVWRPTDGGVTLSVGGSVSLAHLLEWRARRTIEAPVMFRRPARFLNDGVPDFERDLALDGTTLLGTIKSGRLVDVVARGSAIDELAADVRARVRRAMSKWVEPYDSVSAAIATAVLIGDRTGLPDETRNALQAAGTYHVIAISGGNIAVVAAAACGLFALCGIRGRTAAVLVVVVLIAYATVVTAGPSVWRATLMATAYFVARAIDQRTPVWQAMAVAAAGILVIRPLDVADPGFVLTFGATAALVEGARRGVALLPRAPIWSWIMASVIGSVAVEAALLPVSALAFSRVTSAGLILNLLAVPAMALVQIAAMVLLVTESTVAVAGPAAWLVHHAAAALVSSAQLVTEFEWLAARVPPPGATLLLAYYAAMTACVAGRGRVRVVGAAAFVAALLLLVSGVDLTRTVAPDGDQRVLRLTMFDVGQGESMLLDTPSRTTILIDTGGAPFGGGLDIGQRVLAPALWARGIRELDTLATTHSDPDHIGGALAVVEDFAPRRVWEGIRVPRHEPTHALIDAAARRGITVASLRSGRDMRVDGVRIRVLHPPEPDWERRRVRNDDSLVIEVVYGDVAMLLTGDVSADVERAIVPLLTHARTRILKVAHHGSRTSTSRELLDAWRPQVALVSCGRGNRFGHPAAEVISRLEDIGATVLRTDLEGQITIETNGSNVNLRTFVGRQPHD